MEKRLENIKASTVFQVQWFANSENYNAAASVISQGKRVFPQGHGACRYDPNAPYFPQRTDKDEKSCRDRCKHIFHRWNRYKVYRKYKRENPF